jgi:hypothetical protein
MASMQYDVKSVQLSADGQAVNSRTRVKAIYGVAGAALGSVKFYDGTSTSDELLINIDTPAGTGNSFYMMVPGEGVLFRTGVFVDVTNITGVTIYYG